MFHLFIICLNGQKEGFFNCLGKQQLNCVCNNLLWDACLWCKHWRPQVVVNGRKILRMWQKGKKAQCAKCCCRERRLLCIFPQLNCAAFCIELNYLPLHCTLALAQPLCQGLLTTVGRRTKTLILETPCIMRTLIKSITVEQRENSRRSGGSKRVHQSLILPTRFPRFILE